MCHNAACQFRLAGLPATARRVVRGGSWNNDQVNARASYRNDNAPDNRNNNLGLRVVRSSHILIPLHGTAERKVTYPAAVASLLTGMAGTGSASGIGR